MSLNGPAAARLYDEHVDAIYTYAARRVGPDAAVTVVEEVFEQALRKNAERPPHTSSDLGWLLAMTTAFLRRHSEAECRRLQAWQPTQRATSTAVPRVSDPLLTNDSEDPSLAVTTQVMAAVADLEPVERDVLFLVAWEGCSSALTAAATGLPQNEIRPTLNRIRKEIRHKVIGSKAEPAAAPAKNALTRKRKGKANQSTPVTEAPSTAAAAAAAALDTTADADEDAEAWVNAVLAASEPATDEAEPATEAEAADDSFTSSAQATDEDTS